MHQSHTDLRETVLLDLTRAWQAALDPGNSVIWNTIGPLSNKSTFLLFFFFFLNMLFKTRSTFLGLSATVYSLSNAVLICN